MIGAGRAGGGERRARSARHEIPDERANRRDRGTARALLPVWQ